MKDKGYLFNPFTIKEISNDVLKDYYNDVFNKLNTELNTPYQFAENIEIYSNLNYIIGEMIARLTHNYISLKTEIQIKTAVDSTKARKDWDVSKEGKHPAISYFEALAISKNKDLIDQLAEVECSLKRFKNAYISTEEKINAIKKQLDAIKYEEFGVTN